MAEESPWLASGAPRGDDYQAQIAARLRGKNPHGEVDFIEDLLRRMPDDLGPAPLILDGGCGTGRVAVELARRGYEVLGVDSDPQMLAVAQRNAPSLHWVLADLASVELDVTPELVVLAGNVMIFLDRGQEQAVLRNLTRLLAAGGLLIAGFQLGAGRIEIQEYDGLAEAAGLHFVERWASWDRAPWYGAANYAVSVHRRRT